MHKLLGKKTIVLLYILFLKWLHTYLVVRFLALVTTMVTKVDHGKYRSNHRGYYDGYYDGNTFFLQEYIFLDDFLRFSIIFESFHTQ